MLFYRSLIAWVLVGTLTSCQITDTPQVVDIPPGNSGNNGNTSNNGNQGEGDYSGDSEPPSGSCTIRSQPNKYPGLNITPSQNPVCNGWHPACAFIQTKYAAGLAAGNSGDLYQNIDNNHARAGVEAFPQVEELQRVPSGQLGVLADIDNWNRRGSPVIANGSYVVVSGGVTYSSPRYYYHRKKPGWPAGVHGVEKAIHYFENNAHVWHPEHLDFDNDNKYYTHLPAIGVSQGSSGSELDEILHQYAVLAALRPDVKNWLRSRALLMPVMLMAHRWGRAGSNVAYLEGSTHRGALDDVNGTAAVQMATLANSITIDTIPPFAKIAPITETFQNNGEILFNTYQTMARMFIQNVAEQTIEVSAEDSFDVNCLPLTYTWKVLGGEFDTSSNRKVFIEPLEQGSWKKVRIRIQPHTFVAPGTASTTSKMIYIGLFVNNGHFYSLPSIISVSSDASLVPPGF